MQIDQSNAPNKDVEMMNASSIGEEGKDQDVTMNVESEKLTKKASHMSPVKTQAEEAEEKGGIISQTFFG